LIHLKGWLFLLILLVSAGVVLLELPSWRIAVLLVLLVWSSARFYYYLFYVIEHYVDPEFKFAGVGAAIRYLLSKRRDRTTE
jgi:Na+-transporting methylmalonyl-CoA/oxaloacetate decarboxylase beta subunit